MEEHAVTARLNNTRERIRAMLIPDPVSGRIESDSFPRSAVMRFAFDARARSMLLTGASLLMMFMGGRSRKVAKLGLLPQLVRSVGALTHLVRR